MTRRPALTKTVIAGLETILPFILSDYENMTATHGHNTTHAHSMRRGLEYIEDLTFWYRAKHPTPDR